MGDMGDLADAFKRGKRARISKRANKRIQDAHDCAETARFMASQFGGKLSRYDSARYFLEFPEHRITFRLNVSSHTWDQLHGKGLKIETKVPSTRTWLSDAVWVLCRAHAIKYQSTTKEEPMEQKPSQLSILGDLLSAMRSGDYIRVLADFRQLAGDNGRIPILEQLLKLSEVVQEIRSQYKSRTGATALLNTIIHVSPQVTVETANHLDRLFDTLDLMFPEGTPLQFSGEPGVIPPLTADDKKILSTFEQLKGPAGAVVMPNTFKATPAPEKDEELLNACTALLGKLFTQLTPSTLSCMSQELLTLQVAMARHPQ